MKNTRWPVLLLILFILCCLSFVAGMVLQQNPVQWSWNGSKQQDPKTIANQFLNRLQTAYETKDVPLLVSLYQNPTVAVDVTRNENRFYTSSGLQTEIEKSLARLSGIKCEFTDRQITVEGDAIMIRTLRSVTAREIPMYANCLMLMVLRKQSKSGFRGYGVTDQILLKEEYVKKPESSK